MCCHLVAELLAEQFIAHIVQATCWMRLHVLCWQLSGAVKIGGHIGPLRKGQIYSGGKFQLQTLSHVVALLIVFFLDVLR